MTKTLGILFTFSLATLLLFGCAEKQKASEVAQAELKNGIWRGVLNVQGNSLPFNFEVKEENGQQVAYLFNAEERLLLDEIYIDGDSLDIPMHIFDADIKAIIAGDQLTGYWKKNYAENYVVSFEAQHAQDFRFADMETKETTDFSGTWAVTFVHEQQDTTLAVAIFEQNGSDIAGTILTPVGDYRYLEGVVEGNTLKVSTFDGGHAFLFTAKKGEDGQLEGDFWSGVSWHETWVAQKDDNATLSDADELTYLKEGYAGVDFSFPNLNGQMVSPNDDRFKGKALILQIFGTWCPNCMDETKFLQAWYEKNRGRDIEILGLAYEAKDDFEYAKKRVQKMKDKLNVGYDFVIAGNSDKKEAAKTLPMLNHVLSFPTTIFINKNGEVKRIHTGFTGPGTGHHYDRFIKEFNETVDEMVGDVKGD